MKKPRIVIILTSLFVVATMLSSCEKIENDKQLTLNNLKGIFIVCEGDFGTANGDITLYDPKSGQTTRSLYNSVNGAALGDVVQSFAIADTLGFIVVNNSQKVTVVNMKDFRVVKTLQGFSYPRGVIRADGNTVYVSNGNGKSDNYIYRINLTTLEKTDSLQLSTGPEKMVSVNSKVYAAISGGWNNDGKTVVEIDPASFSVVNTFIVASVPVDLAADNNQNIWVYCKGKADYSNYPAVTYIDAAISKINVPTKEVTSLAITNMSSSGINDIAVSKDGSTIFYLNDALYSMPVSSSSLPANKFVDQQFYGLDVDPQSGNIVCLDAVNSKAVVYNTTGQKQYDFTTAPFPNSAVFSN